MFSDPLKNIEQFHIHEGMKVADFGVGTGAYAFALADAVKEDGKVYALDIQKKFVTALSKEAETRGLTQIQALWADLEAEGGTQLDSGSLDAVVIANMLFQAEKKEAVLKEAFRILHTKAKILIIDWTESFGGLGPHVDHVFKEQDARRLAENIGFVFEESIQAGAHHYGLIFRKP